MAQVLEPDAAGAPRVRLGDFGSARVLDGAPLEPCVETLRIQLGAEHRHTRTALSVLERL
jgi:hypothetical protein